MDGKKLLLLFAIGLGIVAPARGAVIELSGMVAYNKAQYSDGYKSFQRRYTGSVDFKFTQVSALQFEYTDSITKVSYLADLSNILPGLSTPEATTYKDKIYSFNWVQNLVPSRWLIQPYIVFGGGKMRRFIIREYPVLGIYQSVVQSVATGTGGIGLRIFLTKNMAIKGEIKTYVPRFKFSLWKENQLFSAGLSWVF